MSTEDKVRTFYDRSGWETDDSGQSLDARLWEDLRPAASDYVSACRRKLLEHLPRSGGLFLDAASGPIQYPEYFEYSNGFAKRVCVDISENALAQARAKLGERGEYVRASLLELPFPDNHFDAIASLHTIYHIEKDAQETAVRQLIRVAKPSTNIVIIYANPDRLIAVVKRALLANRSTVNAQAPGLYYHAHPLTWWRRFEDVCDVTILPWRSLAAQDSKRIIPDNAIGALLFKGVLSAERNFPALATRWGAYPMLVLTKKPL